MLDIVKTGAFVIIIVHAMKVETSGVCRGRQFPLVGKASSSGFTPRERKYGNEADPRQIAQPLNGSGADVGLRSASEAVLWRGTASGGGDKRARPERGVREGKSGRDCSLSESLIAPSRSVA